MVKTKTEEPTEKVVKMSSAFVRVIGKTTLEVINAKQNDGVPKAVKSKWFVRETTGKKSKIFSQGDKKYPQIDSLRAREIELKALAQKKTE